MIEADSKGNVKAVFQGAGAIQAGQQVLMAQIYTVRVTRLALYTLSGLLAIIASSLVFFAPTGREALIAVIAVGAFAAAVGAAGFATFYIKAPGIAAGSGENGPPHSD